MRAFDRHCNMVMENVREMWTEVCFHIRYISLLSSVYILYTYTRVNALNVSWNIILSFQRLVKARRNPFQLTKRGLLARCSCEEIQWLLSSGTLSEVCNLAIWLFEYFMPLWCLLWAHSWIHIIFRVYLLAIYLILTAIFVIDGQVMEMNLSYL